MGNKKSKPNKQTKTLPPTDTTQPQNPQNESDSSTKEPISHKRRKKKVPDEFADTLVIDNGSYLLRAGFCGSSSPRAVFPPIVGRPRHASIMIDTTGKDVFVGDEAQSKRGILNINYAIQNRIVQDWNDMTEIWKHTFYNELRISPEEHPLLMTEPPCNPKQNREKTVEIMCEQFNIPSLYLANSSFCAMIASGRSTAIVLDSGYESTTVIPIYEVMGTKKELMIGGSHVTQYWQKQLSDKGYDFTTTAEKEIINVMKCDLGYVAENYDDEMRKAETSGRLSKSYELPDGQVIDSETLKVMRFQCSECLFNPSLIGVESVGISELVIDAIRAKGKYIQEMCLNVLITGGNSKLDGFENRMQKDLNRWINKENIGLVEGYVRENNVDNISTRNVVDLICKYDPKLKVKCIAPPERSYSVWIGASVLVTSLPTDAYITKEDYGELGVSILDKKCTY